MVVAIARQFGIQTRQFMMNIFDYHFFCMVSAEFQAKPVVAKL